MNIQPSHKYDKGISHMGYPIARKFCSALCCGTHHAWMRCGARVVLGVLCW